MNNLVDIEDYTKRLTEELKMKFGKGHNEKGF